MALAFAVLVVIVALLGLVFLAVAAYCIGTERELWISWQPFQVWFEDKE